MECSRYQVARIAMIFCNDQMKLILKSGEAKRFIGLEVHQDGGKTG